MIYVLAQFVAFGVLVGIHELARRLARRHAIAQALAGAGASYLVAVALAFGAFASVGIPTAPRRYAVGDVKPGYDAVGKLEVGDVIVAFEGDPLYVDVPPSLVERVNAKAGAPVTLTIEHAGARRVVSVQPRRTPLPTGGESWFIGIRPVVDERRVHDASAELVLALRFPVEGSYQWARWYLAEHAGEPGGPVRTARILQERHAISAGLFAWVAALVWAAYLVVDAVRLALRLRRE